MKYIPGILLLLFIVFASLPAQQVYVGTTMGFADYMEENCNIVYKENGLPRDPFISMADHGANMVRFRLGHPPYASSYSGGQIIDIESPERVREGLRRARNAGLNTLLTFSYQSFALEDSMKLNEYVAPLAWQDFASDVERLSDSVYQYTYDILDSYCSEGLIPAIVSIGNESVWRRLEPNLPEDELPPYDPERSVALHNAGSRAVRDISQKYGVNIKVCYHMMKPSQTEWWLSEHSKYGLDCDIIGISLYHGWNEDNYGSYSSLGKYVSGIRNKYGFDFLVMETAQLFTSGGNDEHVDILGLENIPDGYPSPPTVETQRKYLVDITEEVVTNGGLGVIVWGAEWLGSSCYVYADRWGAGSSWENKAFWDFDGNLHRGIDWMLPFSGKVPVEFRIDMTGIDISRGVYIRGNIPDRAGKKWQYIPMDPAGNGYFTHTAYIPKDSTVFYYFLNDTLESAREILPDNCINYSGNIRSFIIPTTSEGELLATSWSLCDTIPEFSLTISVTGEGTVSVASGKFSEGTMVALIATPSFGWEFQGWTGDFTSSLNPDTLVMDSDKSIQAVFVERTKVRLTFKVDMTGVNVNNGVYVTGDFENNNGVPWVLNRMPVLEGNNIYTFTTLMPVGSGGAYYFLNDDVWSARELVPRACVGMYNTDRRYDIGLNDTIFGYRWGSCDRIGDPVFMNNHSFVDNMILYPNPVSDRIIEINSGTDPVLSVSFIDIRGNTMFFRTLLNNSSGQFRLDIPPEINPGLYLLRIKTTNKNLVRRVQIL